MNVRLFSVLTTQLFQLYEKSEYICKLCRYLHNCLKSEKRQKKKTWKPCFNTSHEVIMYIFFVFLVNNCGLALWKKNMILWHEFCFIKFWVPVSLASSKRHKAAQHKKSNVFLEFHLNYLRFHESFSSFRTFYGFFFDEMGYEFLFIKKNSNAN